MEAHDEQFIELINGNKQFVIPVFQRDYSWTTDECEQMWNDIIRAGTGQGGGGHFMGSIVYIGTENATATFNTWLVIDGQQRLTTLILLLIALRDHIKETNWIGGDDSPSVEILDDYLTNRTQNPTRKHKLALRRADNATLQALINGEELQGQGHSELVVDAYEWFKTRISNSNPDAIYLGIAQLFIVEVTLNRNIDNPQLVFESLNSTGIDLSQSDLIRNYLLMGLPEKEQTRLYNDYWSNVEQLFHATGNSLDTFLRDYVALKRGMTTQVRADRIYEEFKEFWRSSMSDSHSGPIDELLNDLLRFAGYYATFLRPERVQDQSFYPAMQNAHQMGTASAPLVMRLYDAFDKSRTLPEDDFRQALVLISSYIVRRAVLGLQTRGYWSFFARLARDLDGSSPFESFQTQLARDNYPYGFPTDEEFHKEIQECDLYRLRICLHILTQLENAGQAEPSPVNQYSIEHIMPQNISNMVEWHSMLGEEWEQIHQTWLHRLGNLTLTAYNSMYSNKPFQEKRDIEGGFRESAVRLNQYVREQTDWTEEQIQERGQTLARRALHIWPYHNADEKNLLEARIAELQQLASSTSPDNIDMAPHVRALLATILSQINEIDNIIEIVENKSVCCYGPNFFAEILPAKHHLRVILPLDFNEVEFVDGMSELSIHDTSTWSFVPNRAHTDCDVLIEVRNEDDITRSISIIRQAFNISHA